jgi:menaquinol-cytochrome c reductase cytochrome b subunit
VKLPKPPLPPGLRPRPKRPGDANGANGSGNGRAANGKAQTAVKTKHHPAADAGIETAAWVEERMAAGPFTRAFLYRHVPKGINWAQSLGFATLFAFVSQAFTGVFLAMYYDPSPTQAYASAQHITNEVFLGEFVRGMHKWGSSVMIILIFLHMGRVFFWGAYKYPRELTWLVGVILVVLTLMMGLTGYLLPFDQRSYWATIVAVNLNGTAPILGPYLADFLRGGSDFGATTLSRFYAMHMMLIPGLIAVLIGVHLYLVAKLGITAPPWVKAEKRRELAKEEI